MQCFNAFNAQTTKIENYVFLTKTLKTFKKSITFQF